MQEETDKVGLFAIALRGISDTQGQQLGIVTKESENECVDILCRSSKTALFLDLYTDFKAAGGAWKEYTENLPRRRDEILKEFIGSWLECHPPETFYASEFRKFLIKYKLFYF